MTQRQSSSGEQKTTRTTWTRPATVSPATRTMLYENTNGMPKHADGTTHHLSVKRGDVANRIVSVGSLGRAKVLASLMDDGKFTTCESSRGFTTFTGKKDGVEVSVIATGMGIPNMDFVVRETRAIVDGPMAIIRFGTCGGLQADVAPGSVVVCGPGSVAVTRDPDAFLDNDSQDCYKTSRVMPASPELSTALFKTMSLDVDHMRQLSVVSASPDRDHISVYNGKNATACSYYSSQGRLDSAFDDRNEHVVSDLLKQHPDIHTMEMETFHLLDLAQRSRGTISATAAVLVVANRPTGQVIDGQILQALEHFWGNHRSERTVTLDKGIPWSRLRAIVTLVSYALVLSNIFRAGLGVSTSSSYVTIETNTFFYFRPYAYPIAHIPSNNTQDTTDLWSYKFDTTSIAMRSFAKYFNLPSEHRTQRTAVIEKDIPWSWIRVILTLLSYALALSDVFRAGLGVTTFRDYVTVETNSFFYFGPYAYPIVHIPSNNTEDTTDLWSYKFDTTSIAMRSFAKYFNLPSWPSCLNYDGDCASDILPFPIVFDMLDSLITALARLPIGHGGGNHMRPTTLSLRTRYSWFDCVHDYLLPQFFAVTWKRTVQTVHYPVSLLRQYRTYNLCGVSKVHPYVCNDFWYNYKRVCPPSDDDCVNVGTIWKDSFARMAELRITYPNMEVDLTIIEATDDNPRASISHQGTKSLDLITLVRVRNCSGIDLSAPSNADDMCTTVAVDDYRYEGAMVTTDLPRWYWIVATLRFIGQLYMWVRLVALFVGIYSARSTETAYRSSGIMPRLKATVRAVLAVPGQVIVYGSLFPVACYVTAHSIDSPMVYELLSQNVTTLLGVLSNDVREFLRVNAIQMRNWWVLGILLHAITGISTCRSWSPSRGVPGVPEFLISVLSAATIFSQYRLKSYRNTKVLSVDELPESQTQQALRNFTYRTSRSIVSTVLVDAEDTLFEVWVAGNSPDRIRLLTNFLPHEIDRVWSDVAAHVSRHWNVGRGRTCHTKAGCQMGNSRKALRYQDTQLERMIFGFLEDAHVQVNTYWTMHRVVTSGRAFQHHYQARYATDVTFQQANKPVADYGEAMRYFSSKHKLYGMKTEPGSVADFTIFRDNLHVHHGLLAKTTADMAFPDDDPAALDHPAQWACRGIAPIKKSRSDPRRVVSVKQTSVASDRMIVENISGRMTTLWGLAANKYRWSRERYPIIVKTCVALTNCHVVRHGLREQETVSHHAYQRFWVARENGVQASENSMSGGGDDASGKRWFPLESNPAVMNEFVAKMGFPTHQFSFCDVLSTEEWALDMVPRPVHGVLMLFPIKDHTEAYAAEEAKRIAASGQVVSKNVYYMHQTVGNACGTIGILHAIANMRQHVTFEPTSYLSKLFAATATKTPSEIAAYLEKDDELEDTHSSAAQAGQSEQIEDVDDPVNTHFVCFTHVDGNLYELDGRKKTPVNHGPSSADTLLPDACNVIKQFMARDEGEVRFTIVALAKTAEED
ncbi:TPA: hypothetical protein N0F65_012772 [Lagenidium giganteum]|uniref:Ubiquitin carboxyl-terminal hydrolase n=1 Tax=Lagenidium giganteum TaxID=4803 RepID=A0AAV2YAA6_9STRA|nr:TPA: hypothetical protein N0F65_012772 [Lagenidium giganteum]